MAYWNWDSSLSIGVDIIDEQHKRILDYINHLDVISQEKNRNKLQNVLNELVDYTITHFTFEEEMMTTAKYPFLSAHKKVHEAFTKRIASYQDRLKSGEDISSDLMSELKIWLTNHIKKDDKDYAPFALKSLNKSEGWLKGALRKFFG